MPDRNSFGALIWKARVDAELTLDDLAQMVGRNRGTIRQWERDICVPTHYAESVVSSLATALGVDKDLLLSVRVARWCKQREPSSRVCSLDGCLNPHCARGFCNMHWNRWRNTGDPGPVNRLIRLPQPLCEVFDCGGKHYGLGLCSKCYQRFKNRRDGPPMSRKCLIGCQCGRHHKTFRAQWVLDLKQVSYELGAWPSIRHMAEVWGVKYGTSSARLRRLRESGLLVASSATFPPHDKH